MNNRIIKSWNIKKETSVENRDTARHLAGQDSLNKSMIMPGASTCSISVSRKTSKNK
ncbi:hypothetical protein [Legionella shakespearei]|uniref:Uncharacterized protein n=1 Tax=Legionella shakespearei DSM 23087 TaxID=1122169 RepID=A0A0W0YVS4_9GAMM|nr:hypothetical protein [Legionella shakespearei]KTD60969.1 hypothetical protein Lsha_1380 [Legionella shakespearei DSM 23087]